VVKTLHDAPAVSWKEEAVRKQEEAYKRSSEEFQRLERDLRLKREELRVHLEYTGKALRNVSAKSFDMITQFLCGDVKWVVIEGYSPELVEWRHGMYEGKLRLLSLFGRDYGSLSFSLSAYCDGSDEYRNRYAYTPFSDYKDALAKWLELASKKVNDDTIAQAKKHGVNLPAKAVKEWMAKKVEGIDKEVAQQKLRIEALKKQKAEILKKP
jgi:hypothetical protein